MPLEDLLAFYGCEPVIPVMASSSVDSSPSELADELPDMTLDKVSQNHFPFLICFKDRNSGDFKLYFTYLLMLTKYVS